MGKPLTDNQKAIREFNTDDYVYALNYYPKGKEGQFITLDTWKEVCDFTSKNGIQNYSTKMVKKEV